MLHVQDGGKANGRSHHVSEGLPSSEFAVRLCLLGADALLLHESVGRFERHIGAGARLTASEARQ